MFSESSSCYAASLAPCCTGKQVELSENCLQSLRKKPDGEQCTYLAQLSSCFCQIPISLGRIGHCKTPSQPNDVEQAVGMPCKCNRAEMWHCQEYSNNRKDLEAMRRRLTTTSGSTNWRGASTVGRRRPGRPRRRGGRRKRPRKRWVQLVHGNFPIPLITNELTISDIGYAILT